jgi:NAD(P)-dependent dehydrogenase (short-subunit alcohol dehydrogenase family)
LAIRANTADFEEVSQVINEVLENFDRVDVLINNVALAKGRPIWKIG